MAVMWLLLAQSLYFFLPAYGANMAPVLFRGLPFGKPISEKWFGRNKTWRGLIIAPLIGLVIFFLQKIVYGLGFGSWALIDYNGFSIFLGFVMGLGAIVGDLVKSYYKRKAGIPVGAKWLPWDQLDFVMGGLVFTWLVYVPPAEVALVIVIISPFLHIIVNHVGYWLKIRKEKW